ncbi:unnamed protein product [Brachionus calyciflorus]|uniref:Purinergic receptor n=1 Tax=Brachionus calyciflorus TaxID=104777 RepID=A0A814CWQ4_9BILA|nr:unnamed protein product [Brachionus calyciflorus]
MNVHKFERLKNSFLSFFVYSTVRSATIKSHRVGIAYRLAQIILLVYIIGWELILKKGYQAFDSVSSSVTTKVKGQGFVPINATINSSLNKNDPFYYEKLFEIDEKKDFRLLDTADYIIPPNEYNSIFIMSNFIETTQTQGVCDEEVSKPKAKCYNESDCLSLGINLNSWNGIPTGKCVNSSTTPGVSVCEIRAWCPVEHESERNEDHLIRNVLNYTIFIKNDVEFKKFKKKERNILPFITNQYISKCKYHNINDPYCPVFQVDYILSMAEPDKKQKYQMLIKGGVVVIDIIWECDFDFNKQCLPKFGFRRFDTKETNTASGFNFRFANKFRMYDKEYRTLFKAYGLRFIINVSGIGGKFSIVPLMMTIGAGLGLMSISVIIADCVMLHCTKNKTLYQKIKEGEVKKDLLAATTTSSMLNNEF